MDSARRFGVEIECGHPQNSEGVRKLLREEFKDADENGYKAWRVGADGSGVEARTPILQGEEGCDVLRRGMDLIRESGGYTTRSDGMHVHIEAKDYIKAPNVEPLQRVVESWVNNEDLIDKFVHPYRRTCAMTYKIKYGEMQNHSGGYRNLQLKNVLGLRKEGLSCGWYKPTFEVRLHEGTLDPDEAIPWVKFLVHFFDSQFEGEPLPKFKACSELLEALNVEPDALGKLVEKSTTSDKKVFGERPYDPDGNPNPGHWWCNECENWHKVNSAGCGWKRDCHDQDSYHGKYVEAGGQGEG